jgi:Domain of unknown function (DUF5666)
MKQCVAILLLVISMNVLLIAHGDMEHVLGTVVKVSDQALSVKVADGSVKVVLIDGETRFLKGNSPASASDVQVGRRVVIHAHRQGETLHAAEVKIGTDAFQQPHQ